MRRFRFGRKDRCGPEDGAGIDDRASTHLDKTDVDRAIADFTDSIRLSPPLGPAYNNRGNAYRAKGDLDRANADFDKVQRLEHEQQKR